MAQNLVRLSLLAGDEKYRERADRLMEGTLPLAAENLFGHAALLNALDLRLRHREVLTTGALAEDFARAALKLSFLDRTVLRARDSGALPAGHPAHARIAAAPPDGAAFICVGESCSLPILQPSAIADAGIGEAARP
jgi:uncharacterized protein